MIADVDPGAQLAAGGTAVSDPGAATIIGQRLAARREMAPQRVGRELDQAFGPYQDPHAIREGTAQAKAALGTDYQAAIQNAPRLSDQVKGDLRVRFSDIAKGMTQSNRQIVSALGRQLFDAVDHASPQIATSRLLDLRKTLDAQIAHDPRAYAALSSADKAAQRPLQQIRDIVNDTLKQNIPGIRQADANYAPLARRQAAFDEGREKVYRGGPKTMTEGELRSRYAQSTPQENAMRGHGMRAELERSLSNERMNAGVTIDRTLNRDFNMAKTAAQISPSRADSLRRGLDREQTFVETSNMGEVGRGSRTTPLRETAQRMWGRGDSGGAVADMSAAFAAGTLGGGPIAGTLAAAGVGASRGARSLVQSLSRPAVEVIQKTADDLTATGVRRQAIIQELMNRAAQIPKRQQTSDRIQDLVSALLLGQSGRTGAETQAAFFGRAGR